MARKITRPARQKRVVIFMEFDLLGKDADDAYRILSSLVTPRPIAWVTTLNLDGSVNAAPFSHFNVLGDDPPMVMFCPGNRADGTPKDTALNCRRSGEFVVNFVDESLAQQMVNSSASLPYGESELTREGLATMASSSIAVPRIALAPAALECTVHDIQEIGNNRLIIGLVQRVQVIDALVDLATHRIRNSHYHPIGRMASPDWYCQTQHQFEMPRPR